MSENERRGHHRPAFMSPAAMEAHGGAYDPTEEIHAAHETASALVHAGRAAADPDLTTRLVAIVDDIGLSTLAELWSQRPARSLPGALWRLYVLREWVRRAPEEASREYAAGMRFTTPDHAVAGAAEPPGPTEMSRVIDEILRGVFEGDLAVALERAAAFCRVVSAGRADVSVGDAAAEQAANVLGLGDDLAASARLWRADALA
ncbi:hypothetical protein [Terracoccus luteus]|jgi:hypothetical protein|uniref:DNA-directed RNA polymerase subunit beta n=1 Tax=Terracoccus luteus TaxID=53356 RepID=A0A495XT66_9MICO|nr:hypothetical protein [Terracoccus luteus]MBB2986729.1 hypothetical protein [Terracoccus luteus]MCP2172380.1 hypothetical protein [Terracoccus luteus]RKT76779.1 hypothetical protein DFJ68_0179 [Terracoccus luteus]